MQNRKQRESEIEFIKEYNSFHFTDTVHNVQTYIFNSQSTTTIHDIKNKYKQTKYYFRGICYCCRNKYAAIKFEYVCTTTKRLKR